MRDYRIFYETPKGKNKLNIIIQGKDEEEAKANFKNDFPERKIIETIKL